MAFLTDEEIARRVEIMKSALERDPSLTAHHFTRFYGWQKTHVCSWGEKHGLVFGKNTNIANWRKFKINEKQIRPTAG
jgi:hypothetical protein